jgi:hypothetical protein
MGNAGRPRVPVREDELMDDTFALPQPMSGRQWEGKPWPDHGPTRRHRANWFLCG